MRIELRLLGADGDVGIAETVAFLCHKAHSLNEQFLAVDALEARVGIGEVETDVAQSCCPEQGIAQGVKHHIGIAVTQQSQAVRYVYTTHPKFTTLNEAVNIKTHSYTYHNLNRGKVIPGGDSVVTPV